MQIATRRFTLRLSLVLLTLACAGAHVACSGTSPVEPMKSEKSPTDPGGDDAPPGKTAESKSDAGPADPTPATDSGTPVGDSGTPGSSACKTNGAKATAIATNHATAPHTLPDVPSADFAASGDKIYTLTSGGGGGGGGGGMGRGRPPADVQYARNRGPAPAEAPAPAAEAPAAPAAPTGTPENQPS
jgi:hypothetical protein